MKFIYAFFVFLALIAVKAQGDTEPQSSVIVTRTASTRIITSSSSRITTTEPITVTSTSQSTVVITTTSSNRTPPSSSTTSSNPSSSPPPKKLPANNSDDEDSKNQKIWIGVGIAAGVLVVAIGAILIFKHQVGQSEEFKNRLNRGASPPLPSLPYEKNAYMDQNKNYAGYDPEYSYAPESSQQQFGGQFEYNYEPESNRQQYRGQF